MASRGGRGPRRSRASQKAIAGPLKHRPSEPAGPASPLSVQIAGPEGDGTCCFFCADPSRPRAWRPARARWRPSPRRQVRGSSTASIPAPWTRPTPGTGATSTQSWSGLPRRPWLSAGSHSPPWSRNAPGRSTPIFSSSPGSWTDSAHGWSSGPRRCDNWRRRPAGRLVARKAAGHRLGQRLNPMDR